MKKPVTFASSFHIQAALCCSVAVLLSACGGMADESANQQLLADAVASTTAEAPSAMAMPATRTADGSAPALNEFNLNGYQDAASSSDASPQATPATASADGQQATQRPAA